MASPSTEVTTAQEADNIVPAVAVPPISQSVCAISEADMEISLSRQKCSEIQQPYNYLAIQDTVKKHPLTSQRLNQVLDFEDNDVPLHLGKIADSMYEWEGPVADHLGLTHDVEAIKLKHPGELRLQTRAALQKWKQKLGSKATYIT